MSRTAEKPISIDPWVSDSARVFVQTDPTFTENTSLYRTDLQQTVEDQNAAAIERLIRENNFKFFFIVPKNAVVYAQNTDESRPLIVQRPIIVARRHKPGKKEMIAVTNLLPWSRVLYNDGQRYNLDSGVLFWVSRRRIKEAKISLTGDNRHGTEVV